MSENRTTLLLVHTAHPQAVTHAGPNFGRLLSPRQFSRVVDTAEAGIPWAADNDCFNKPIAGWVDSVDWRRMVDSIAGVPGCLFVTAPDVVSDWQATRDRWDSWGDYIAHRGLPAAYVIQDGQPDESVPWDSIAALFIGGSTEYKLSAEAERLARKAKELGLWVHMGRVNSRKRVHYARAIGCDSVDGTQFSMFRDRWIPEGLRWAREHFQERIAA